LANDVERPKRDKPPNASGNTAVLSARRRVKLGGWVVRWFK
jgi:hypothetical protein